MPMIFGLFVNGYKSYSKTAYIPISENEKYKFTTVVGQNGVGKSAILEVLNFFFRQGSWNENRQSKNKDDMFISPVFIIEKVALNKWLTQSSEVKSSLEDILVYINRISNFLWNESDDFFKGATKRPYTEEFVLRKNLVKHKYKNDFYLICIGKDYDFKSNNKPFSGAFKEIPATILDDLNTVLENYYNYIYIPIDQTAYNTLKIENVQMQKIMNRDVVRNIEGFLNKRLQVAGKNQSFIDHINRQLNDFISDINGIIKQVDDAYEFKAKRNQKQNLRPSDIMDNILNAYFSKRTLKNSHKEVEELSSGEQRRAMIDVIYAFLKNRGLEDKSHGRNVILAIDEPEVSQDIKHCFEQFERLEIISNIFGNQVIVTTHWYGILPVIENGTLLHIAENDNQEAQENFSVFDFYNYLDNKKYFPDEVQMKSLYDLAISLTTYMKSETNKHLIICEGGTDKRYLETLIDVSKVRIIPVGGIDNVRSIYRLLVMPLQIERKINNEKRVLCLTDTDENVRDNQDLLKDSSGRIHLRRLQAKILKNELSLVSFDNYQSGEEHSITRIEDVLHVPTWVDTLKELFLMDEKLSIDFSQYQLLSGKTFTNLRGDISILFAKTPEAAVQKDKVIKYIESSKALLSEIYVRKFKERIMLGELDQTPLLFESIKAFFKEDILIDYTIYNNKKELILNLKNVLEKVVTLKEPDLVSSR